MRKIKAIDKMPQVSDDTLLVLWVDEKPQKWFGYLDRTGMFAIDTETVSMKVHPDRIEYLDENEAPTNTASVDAPEDLQDQVRAHIKNDKLFNWDEALSDNEMTYLEQLLLTFNPLCPPGSIGYEEQVRHIARHRGGANTSQHPLQGLIGEDISNEAPGYTRVDVPGSQHGGNAAFDIIYKWDEWYRNYTGSPEDIKNPMGLVPLIEKYLRSQSAPTPPLFLDKLRAASPYSNLSPSKRSEGWNECCDMAATLLFGGEKGEEKVVRVDAMQRMIADMKKKNFREFAIVEEVEKYLNDTELLHKIFPL